MEFTQRYNLNELLAGDGVQSYCAVQISTGRDVTVHLLPGGKTPENEALLVRLRAMHPQSMAKLIEVGEQQGNTYVVTMAPPYQRLDEWLAEQDGAAGLPQEFGKAGFWKHPSPAAPPPVPGVPPSSEVPPLPPTRLAPSSSEPGSSALRPPVSSHGAGGT